MAGGERAVAVIIIITLSDIFWSTVFSTASHKHDTSSSGKTGSLEYSPSLAEEKISTCRQLGDHGHRS